MHRGYIKIYRKITEWEWYKNIPVRILFEHCLLKANHEDKKWQGAIIKKGSFVTSYENLSIETGLTYKQVRNALSKLKTTGEVAHKGHSQYSVITIRNWDKFQGEGSQLGSQRADEGQSKGSQRATTKELKKVKKEKNVEEVVVDAEKLYGKYQNVALSNKQHQQLQAMCLSNDLLIQLMDELSERIEEGKEHPYRAEFPNAHFIRLTKYLEYRRKNPEKFNVISQKSTADILEEIRQKRLAEGKGDF